MFAQRLAGHSTARITRALNDAGVPCPSAADPERNPHRAGTAWTLRTVAAILANPRYTGRQVWNRQRTDFDLVDPANTGLGHRQVQRWNLPEGWVISRHPAHPALVSEADFIAAQDATAPRGPAWPADPAVPASRAAGLRPVRAAAGISVVQRQARLPVPPRPHQRRSSGSGPPEEHLYPRGPDPAAPGRPGHPPQRRRSGDAWRHLAGHRPRRDSRPDRPVARPQASPLPTTRTPGPSAPATRAAVTVGQDR